MTDIITLLLLKFKLNRRQLHVRHVSVRRSVVKRFCTGYKYKNRQFSDQVYFLGFLCIELARAHSVRHNVNFTSIISSDPPIEKAWIGLSCVKF